ncbi:MAG TPA: 16S rRNA (cytosine(967)-C(5))-methyltransferase RsmB [Clostridia bacterium]|nr:16S rRNA (cytosine(967)-C(5))-methyltransferase RsmB [Clostridia bacterium]
MKHIDLARDAAVRAVHRVLREGAYSNIAVKQELDDSGMKRPDKALVTEIVNGTLRNLTRIDWVKSQFIRKTKIDPWIEDILRCGIYQILFLDRVPDSAVCNESAELARKHGHEGTVKFVNGVLRNISRSKEKLEYPDKEKETVKYLSVFYSHPEWMVKKWVKDYGGGFTEELLRANNEAPAFTIRCNRLRISRQELMAVLAEENIDCREGSYNQEAIYIKGTSSIEDKDSFRKGYYQVQDESSMLVAHIIAPKPGEAILDMCSAPGGKTTHMAELMGNEGKIVARDVHQHKLKLIEENCSRLGLDIVRTELYDATKLDEASLEKFDRVLLDAPCSGLGVIRRKPDLRWKKEPDNFRELAKLQGEMLDAASRYVKPEGTLIYSTCTINKTENIAVVRDFLSRNSQFRLESLIGRIPENLECESASEGYLELFPNTHGTDGFFIARIEKR